MLSTCKEVCNNGYVTMSEECDICAQVGSETTDTFNSDYNHCTSTCKFNPIWWNTTTSSGTTWTNNTCGDSHILGGEICDTGSVSDSAKVDGCNAKCTSANIGWLCTTTDDKSTCVTDCGDG